MEHCDIEALSAFIDGELPEESAARLRAHMEECPNCRALAEDMAALKEGFAALEAEPPDTLAPGILYKISLGEEPPRRRRVVRSLVSVAACLIAALVISRTVYSPQLDSYFNLSGGGMSSEVADMDGLMARIESGETGTDDSMFTAESPQAWFDSVEEAGNAREYGESAAAPPLELNEAEAGAESGFGYDAFLELLDQNGFTYTEETGDHLLSVQGKSILTGDESFSVYEYDSNEAMEYDARHVRSNGYTITLPGRSAYYSWILPPNFYKKDVLIVLYVGEDNEIIRFLTDNLGEQFTEAR
ncbi:MAG: zf-HC2 domain-containing protein [Oscillospiraceae bacterium]|jgi:hypothetical protein|nr:zf-HC2 domain-containing protein [Oscillospiraceae bacterium]